MSLSLKIRLVTQDSDQTKIMKFAETMSIGEAIQQIREKTGIGGPDFGLFQPLRRNKQSKPRWLKNDKSLTSYEIESETLLEYKKRHRLLKVKLLDDTQKVILIDDAYTTTEMVAYIGEKMGLRNPEEFSLAVDGAPEGEWLHPHMTLHEQNVSNDAVIVLKKKFFVSDANIDTENPLTLHYLYLQVPPFVGIYLSAQAQTQIMAGQHPLTLEEALTFAALQCQISFGNYDPDKHKVGFLKGRLKDFVAPQHLKVKDIEPGIFKIYKKFVGMNETNAKMRFVQLCRSLKTYGITYFNAKESSNTNGKQTKKMKPVLIGITRDSFMKIDPETKEVFVTYQLKHIRRWAATKNNFTLDVGDYADSYMHYSTPEAEKISQLLSGYIDIILKRTKDNSHIIEEDTSLIASEEEIGVIRSVALASVSNAFNFNSGGAAQAITSGNVPTPTPNNAATYKGPNFAPSTAKLVIANKNTAAQALGTLIDALSGSIPEASVPLNNTSPQRSSELLQEYAAALTGVAIPLLDVGRIEGEAAKLNLDHIAKQVGIHASKLADAAVVQGMGHNYGANLIEAAKRVCQAMKDLIGNADALAVNPTDEQAKLSVQKAAQLFKVAKVQLQAAPFGKLLDRPSQQVLASSATALAFSVDDLLKAAEGNDDPVVKASIGRAAEIAEEVVAAISHYAPLLLHPEYKNAIADPIKMLQSQMNAIDMDALSPSLQAALSQVADSLSQINAASGTAITEESLEKPKQLSEASKGLSMATARLLSSVGMGDVALVGSSTEAAKAAVDALVLAGRSAALSSPDKHVGQSLLAACDIVLDAFKNVVAAANIAAEDPTSDLKQASLLTATQKLAAAAQKLVGNAENQAARDGLRASAKNVIASAVPLALAAKGAAKSVNNPNPDLLRFAQAATDALTDLIESLKVDDKESDSPEKLLNAASKTSVSVSNLVAASQATAPGIQEYATRHALQTHAEATSRSLADLVEATNAIAEATGGGELEDALQQLSIADSSLDAAIITSASGGLKPISGQTEENAGQMLNVASKAFSTASEKLVAVASNIGQHGAVGLASAAKGLAQKTLQVANCTQSFASTVPKKEAQQKVLKSAKSLMNGVAALMAAAKASSDNPTDDVLLKMLQTAHVDVSDNIAKVVGSIKASDDPIAKDCDAAVESIEAELIRLSPNFFSSGEFSTFADEVDNCSKALQASLSQVIDVAQSNPHELGLAAQTASGIVASLINVANQAAATCKKDEDKYNLLECTRKLSQAIVRLIGAAKTVVLNKDDPELKAELRKFSKSASENMDSLTNALNLAVPGIRSLDVALQDISRSSSSSNQPVTDMPKTSGSLVEELTSAAKALASSTSKIVSSARTNPENTGTAAINAAEAIGRILSVTKASASGNTANAEGMKDFIDPARKIDESLKVLVESEGKPGNIITAMKTIAAATSELVSNTKSMATTLKDPNSQQKLLKAAQSIAEPSQKLVGAAKAAAAKAPNSQGPLVQAAHDLQDVMNAVLSTASSVLPSASQSMKPEEKSQYENLSSSAQSLANSTSALISAAKSVSVKPKDPVAHSELSKAAKGVSEHIQELLNAAQGLAPEQIKCDEAIENIASSMENLDAALLSATVGGLESMPDKDPQQSKENLIADSLGLSNSIAKLVNSALNKNSKEIGENAAETASKINTLVFSSSIAAATTSDIRSQKQLLELAKIVSESVMDLLNVIKGGDQIQVADKARESSDAIKNLVSTLKLGVVGARDCDEAAKAIIASAKSLDNPLDSTSKSYKQCKDDLAIANKALATSIQHLVSSARGNVAELGTTSRSVAETINRVITATKNAVAASGSPSVKEALVANAKSVSGAAREIIINSKVLASDTTNVNSQKKLAISQKAMNDSVEHLMASLSTGEIDTEDAIDEIRKLISNLDTASLFASAGQLEAEEKVGTVEESQSNLINASKAVEANGGKVTGITSPEQLGASAKEMAASVARMATSAKTTAALLADSLSQQKIITAAKGCAISAQQLLLAAKDSQSSLEDPKVVENLKTALKATGEALQNLTQTTEATIAEATIGDKKINAVKAEVLRMFDRFGENDYYGNQNATAMDVVDSAKNVATATARLISATSKSQDELIDAAKLTAKEANQLLSNLKGVIRLTKDQGTKKAIPEAGSVVSKAMTNLFDSVKNQGGKLNSALGHQKISVASEQVADAIAEVLSSINKLPGADKAVVDDNIEEKAEEELNAAAKAIEVAAATLQQLTTTRQKQEEENGMTELQVTDAILDSAKAITTATASLIKIAVNIQKDVLVKEKSGANKKLNKFYRKDSIFAEGLISAAKAVSATTQQLVKNANSSIQGQLEEEGLIAAAKAVGAATAQLVSASKVKSPDNPSQPRLQEAAKSVASATSTLVSAATASAEKREEEEREKRIDKYTNSIVQEMEQQMKILKLEKELEKARNQMKALRAQGYATPQS